MTTPTLLCDSIDTLSMTYLDGELAASEERELEQHLLVCETCNAHVEQLTLQMDTLRTALATPSAPAALRAAVHEALDAAATPRRGWQAWLLPGAASLAAAAALLFFAASPARQYDRGIAADVVRQQARLAPLEVQGPGTYPWLRQHFASAPAPTFASARVELQGARLTSVAGHDAAQLQYVLTTVKGPLELTAFVVEHLSPSELPEGQRVELNGQQLHLATVQDAAVVTYMQGATAYVFLSRMVTATELAGIVASSDLIRRTESTTNFQAAPLP